MSIIYSQTHDIDLLMPNEFKALEKNLPPTHKKALRATLWGLLEQEADGADVRDRIVEVCEELDC